MDKRCRYLYFPRSAHLFVFWTLNDAPPHEKPGLVTAIQVATQEQNSSSKDVAALPSGSAYVTFGVDSLQAANIIHSQEFGSIWLTKQGEDTPAGNKTPITINEVLK